MKTKQKNKFLTPLASGLLIFLCLFPLLGKSQAGQNDADFNTANNGSSAGEKGANNKVTTSIVQPNRKIIIAGAFTSYNNIPTNHIARLNADGTLDAAFYTGTGANDVVSTIALQADKKIIIGGKFTSYNGVAVNHIARLNENGSLDRTFITGVGTNDIVSSVVIQPNKKILIAGRFTSYNNGPVNDGIIRLNLNGTVDATFNFTAENTLKPNKLALHKNGKIIVAFSDNFNDNKLIMRLEINGAIDPSFNYEMSPVFIGSRFIEAILILPNGKIIFGGGKATNLESRNGFIYRLNENGSVDSTFKADIVEAYRIWIHTLSLQPNGKIILAGRSAIYADEDLGTKYIARLEIDGAVDPTFNGRNTLRERHRDNYTTSIQPDGKIILGGYFVNPHSNITRLNADGSTDISFNKKTGVNGTVKNIVIQANQKIVIAGEFSSYNEVKRNTIARLNANGSLDASFNPGSGVNGRINSTAIQPDNKIIIAGNFTAYNGTLKNNITRLHPNGTIDASFNTGTGITGVVNTIAVQPDGKVIVAGNFTAYNEIPLKNIARLNTDGTLDLSFNADAGTVLALKLQTGGKVILGGTYGTGLTRLNSDGSLDVKFAIPGWVENIRTIDIQTDGKIIIGADRFPLHDYDGSLSRLNPDGSLDQTFANRHYLNDVKTVLVLPNNKISVGDVEGIYLLNSDGTVDSTAINDGPGANDQVWCSALTADGKSIIGGDFTSFNGVPRNCLARILNPDNTILRLPEANTTFTESETAAARLYPNPATTHLTVDQLQIGNTLMIFNTLGKLVNQQVITSEKVTIETADYANGIYFMTTTHKGKISSTKFIVNKP